jgi:hypothetical protein
VLLFVTELVLTVLVFLTELVPTVLVFLTELVLTVLKFLSEVTEVVLTLLVFLTEVVSYCTDVCLTKFVLTRTPKSCTSSSITVPAGSSFFT